MYKIDRRGGRGGPKISLWEITKDIKNYFFILLCVKFDVEIIRNSLLTPG